MKSMDLLKSLGNVQDAYVISAEEFRLGKGKNPLGDGMDPVLNIINADHCISSKDHFA